MRKIRERKKRNRSERRRRAGGENAINKQTDEKNENTVKKKRAKNDEEKLQRKWILATCVQQKQQQQQQQLLLLQLTAQSTLQPLLLLLLQHQIAIEVQPKGKRHQQKIKTTLKWHFSFIFAILLRRFPFRLLPPLPSAVIMSIYTLRYIPAFTYIYIGYIFANFFGAFLRLHIPPLMISHSGWVQFRSVDSAATAAVIATCHFATCLSPCPPFSPRQRVLLLSAQFSDIFQTRARAALK